MRDLREAIAASMCESVMIYPRRTCEDPERVALWLKHADAALTAIKAAGFVVAPKEATGKMQRFGAAEMWEQEKAQPGVVGYRQAAAIYAAMLAKAAKP